MDVEPEPDREEALCRVRVQSHHLPVAWDSSSLACLHLGLGIHLGFPGMDTWRYIVGLFGRTRAQQAACAVSGAWSELSALGPGAKRYRAGGDFLDQRDLGDSSVHDAWKRQEPVQHALPPVAFALVTLKFSLQQAVLGGLCSTDVFCWVIAHFRGFVQRQDRLLPGKHNLGQAVVLLLRKTKHGIPHGERTVLKHPVVVAWVQRCVQEFSGDSVLRLCVASYFVVAAQLDRHAYALGFAPRTCTTHSLRRGGATALHMQRFSISDIHGVWSLRMPAKSPRTQALVLMGARIWMVREMP
eukprot:4175177-Amphidinium_carterae.1